MNFNLLLKVCFKGSQNYGWFDKFCIFKSKQKILLLSKRMVLENILGIVLVIIFNLSKMDPKRVVTFTLLLKPSFPSTCEFAVTLDNLYFTTLYPSPAPRGEYFYSGRRKGGYKLTSHKYIMQIILQNFHILQVRVWGGGNFVERSA